MYRHAMLVLLAVGFSCLQFARAADDSLSIGPRFHHETGFDDFGFVGESISWGNKLPLYKTYSDARRIKLPTPAKSPMLLDSCLQERRSVRSFSDRTLGMGQLARLLLSANALTHSRGGFDFRTAPSGGALYPLDIYIFAHYIESLEDGLYHFQVSDSSLELVFEGDFSDRIHEAANGQSSVGSSPVTIVLTARFARSTAKYADRGYRYTYVECGAISQNVYLQATALGLGTVAVGAFNDEAVNDLLGVDGLNEAALLIMPVGYPSGE